MDWLTRGLSMSNATMPGQPLHQYEHHQSGLVVIWMAFRNHKGALVGIFVLGFIVLAILVGPLLYSVDPHYLDVSIRNQGISWDHFLGTDNLGRDMLAQLLAGGRIALAVGITSMLLSLFLGTLIGVLAGLFQVFGRTFDAVHRSFPCVATVTAIARYHHALPRHLAFSVRSRSGDISANRFCHRHHQLDADSSYRPRRHALVEGTEFVQAAVSIGTSNTSIVFRHILPNMLSPIMVSATLGVANAVITESTLSFLGLGFPPDFPTWGRLLFDGANFITITPARVLWPGLAISLVVLSVNYIGDALRDAIDPRSRKLET